MENMFGITEEDLSEFKEQMAETKQQMESIIDPMEYDLEGFLSDPKWLPMAHRIARLPGINNEAKVAAIMTGPALVFGMLLLLHLPVAGAVPMPAAIHMFASFMEYIGYGDLETGAWVSLFYVMGVVQNYPTEEASLSSNAQALDAMFLPNTNRLWHSMATFLPRLESLGVVFEEDYTILEQMTATPLVDIKDLAPDEA